MLSVMPRLLTLASQVIESLPISVRMRAVELLNQEQPSRFSQVLPSARRRMQLLRTLVQSVLQNSGNLADLSDARLKHYMAEQLARWLTIPDNSAAERDPVSSKIIDNSPVIARFSARPFLTPGSTSRARQRPEAAPALCVRVESVLAGSERPAPPDLLSPLLEQTTHLSEPGQFVVRLQPMESTLPPPPILEWMPKKHWSPAPPERVASMDYRSGYSWVWRMASTLSEIRRPYLLRMDLPRIAPISAPEAAMMNLSSLPISLASDAIKTAPETHSGHDIV